MPILASKMLFVCEKLLDKKIFSSFSRKFGYLLSKKDLEMKSDPFRSDPWFFGSTIRSRSSRRKWICDPITILKKEDLDPKGSRSDHDRHISVRDVTWHRQPEPILSMFNQPSEAVLYFHNLPKYKLGLI